MKTTESPRPANPVLDEEDAERIEDRASPAPDRVGPPAPRPEGPAPRERKDSGQYRLLTHHLIEGQMFPPGTVVGRDTDIPYEANPSNQMEGLDDESKAKVNELHQALYGRDAPWHDDEHPLAIRAREAAQAEKDQAEEAKSEPVSHQQAFERGHREYRGAPVVPPQLRGPPSPTSVSGDRSIAMGPAAPMQDPLDDAVKTRTAEPLKDQMPKEGAAGGGTQAPHKR